METFGEANFTLELVKLCYKLITKSLTIGIWKLLKPVSRMKTMVRRAHLFIDFKAQNNSIMLHHYVRNSHLLLVVRYTGVEDCGFVFMRKK